MDTISIPSEILPVQSELKKQELVESRLDFPDLFQQILDNKLKNLGLEHLACGSFFLIGNESKLYLPPKNMSRANLLSSIYLGKFEFDERYKQVFLNMFHNHEIGAKEFEEALKSSEEEYDPPREGYYRLIHRGHVAGTSLSQHLSFEGAGNSSTNAPREGDLEMGFVNNNADPPAPGVPSSVGHHVEHAADGSSSSRVPFISVATTIFQVATASNGTATSKFAQASHTTSFATSIAAILLADTKWKAATSILEKASILVCGVGFLIQTGKDLPLPLFMAATSAALLIIIVAIAKRSA